MALNFVLAAAGMGMNSAETTPLADDERLNVAAAQTDA
jgi:hypothetical protein